MTASEARAKCEAALAKAGLVLRAVIDGPGVAVHVFEGRAAVTGLAVDELSTAKPAMVALARDLGLGEPRRIVDGWVGWLAVAP